MSVQPAKRRRGRPRKDSSLKQAEAARTPGSEAGTPYPSQRGNRTKGTECMVGQAVTGFIEATFDSGYLLSVRIGNSNINLRGVVFKPGHCVPITAENDIAPHAQMIRRSDIRFTVEKQGRSPGLGSSMQTGGVVRSKRKRAPPRTAPAVPQPVGGSQASHHGDADVHVVEPLSMLPPGQSIPAGQVFAAMQSYPGCQVAPGSQQHNDGLSNKGTSEVEQHENHMPKTATTDAEESLKSSTESSEQEIEDTIESFLAESSHREPLFNYGVGKMTELLKAQENSKERQVQMAEQPTSASQVEFHKTATGECGPKDLARVSHVRATPDPVTPLAPLVTE